MKKSKYKAKKEASTEVEAAEEVETPEPTPAEIPEGEQVQAGQVWKKASEQATRTYEEARKLFEASTAERKRVRRRQTGYGFVVYQKVAKKG